MRAKQSWPGTVACPYNALADASQARGRMGNAGEASPFRRPVKRAGDKVSGAVRGRHTALDLIGEGTGDDCTFLLCGFESRRA